MVYNSGEMKRLRTYLLLILIPVLTSCATTGTRDISMINFELPGDNESALFFVRERQFTAGGQPSKILVDNIEVSKISSGEMDKIIVKPGRHIIRTEMSNVLGVGIVPVEVTVNTKNGSSHYFIIYYKAGLLTGKFSITETTKNGFLKASN